MDSNQLDNIFTYHKPTGNQQARYVSIREQARMLAVEINQCCPESREKSLALTSVQQSVMWANAAIAINESE